MQLESIRTHLRPYSILERRKTTINHAFASAMAPVHTFDRARVAEALRQLGQDPDGVLLCVYCNSVAETWDHLVSLVKAGQLHGGGHQIGNLVPCCRACNSRKGGKPWRTFIEQQDMDSAARQELAERIERYASEYAVEVNLAWLEEEYTQQLEHYRVLRERIFELMREADEVAEQLRSALQQHASPNR